MPNTSATGGYLVPAANPAPLEDEEFDTFLHDIFVGLTGIDGALVRARWQLEPANMPEVGSDWIAFGIQNLDPDVFAYEEHHPDGDGYDELQRHETVDILISAYGPNAMRNLSQLRDGIQVTQNRDVLSLAGMGVVQSGSTIPAPTLVKDRWLRRFDMTMTIRRQIRRVYPILNLLKAQGTIHAEEKTVFDDSINTPA